MPTVLASGEMTMSEQTAIGVMVKSWNSCHSSRMQSHQLPKALQQRNSSSSPLTFRPLALRLRSSQVQKTLSKTALRRSGALRRRPATPLTAALTAAKRGACAAGAFLRDPAPAPARARGSSHRRSVASRMPESFSGRLRKRSLNPFKSVPESVRKCFLSLAKIRIVSEFFKNATHTARLARFRESTTSVPKHPGILTRLKALTLPQSARASAA